MFVLSLSCLFLLIISIQSVPVPISVSSHDDFEPPEVENQNQVRIARAIVWGNSQRWPSNKIPYRISSRMSEYGRNQIEKTLAIFHKRTCVRFVKVERNKRNLDYIYFRNADENKCSSSLGRQGGRQSISLGRDCMDEGTIAHEIMHALGFIHEHQREDRDHYVKIHYENMVPGKESQFTKLQADTMTLPYDFNSIMQYSQYGFSKNKKSTITPKVGGVSLEWNKQMDLLDLLQINFVFKCIPGMEDYRYRV